MFPKLRVPAPDFSSVGVWEEEFKEIALSDFKGKYLLLLFYPANFTFICPSELSAFSERAAEFRARNCELIGCSTDSEYAHFAWMHTSKKNAGIGEVEFPLLSDKSRKISKAYGVLNEVTGEAYRGMFLIDTNQNLRQIVLNNMLTPRSVDEALRVLSECQYVDDTGGACPANWRPNGKSMTIDKSPAHVAVAVN